MQDIRDNLTADVAGLSLGVPPVEAGPRRTDGTYADTSYYWDDKRGPGPRIMAADTLEGDHVLNDADERLGNLSHIMIDVPTGRVAYGVLAVGGFLGLGDKLFAIPWSALRLDTENHGFRLSLSKEQLKDAPGFDQDAWPSMADQRWATEIHKYYKARPYWD